MGLVTISLSHYHEYEVEVLCDHCDDRMDVISGAEDYSSSFHEEDAESEAAYRVDDYLSDDDYPFLCEDCYEELHPTEDEDEDDNFEEAMAAVAALPTLSLTPSGRHYCLRSGRGAIFHTSQSPLEELYAKIKGGEFLEEIAKGSDTRQQKIVKGTDIGSDIDEQFVVVTDNQAVQDEYGRVRS